MRCASALPAGADEEGADPLFETEMVVGDYGDGGRRSRVDASGAGALRLCGMRSQGAVFPGRRCRAEHFAVAGNRGVPCGGDHHRTGHDPASDTALTSVAFEEHVDELGVIEALGVIKAPSRNALRSRSSSLQSDTSLLERLATPSPFTRSSSLRVAHGVDVGLHDANNRPVDTPAAFEQRREEAVLAQLGDLALYSPRPCRQQPGTTPVTLRDAPPRCPTQAAKSAGSSTRNSLPGP
jgi:hypothetical protein